MTPFLYQYLVGGAVFAGGLVLTWRAGTLGPTRRARLRRALALTGGLLLTAALQAVGLALGRP